ncbi:MAG TPA: GNAT family N-acetyltransferase [Actinomycetales bacterium]|nr:GNAT family N-acetyltransferase [Actinomycetales bacterium]
MSVPTVVPLGPDRRDDWLAVDDWAWSQDPERSDKDASLLGVEWDRTFGAELDGEVAGIYAVFSLRTPVPGGDVPTAGLTGVGVHPHHRRRGVLTAMMRHHLATVQEAGAEPVSALWAAEPGIYGRFGYGMATRGQRFTLLRGAAMADVPGTDALAVRFERADTDRHAPLVAACHEAARRGRPGMVSRDSEGLQRRMLADPKDWREGGEPLKVALVTDAGGGVRGYALFRRKEKWEVTGPDGTVSVREAVTLDGAASRVLWGRLADLDLMGRVETGARPLDDPLVHQLVDMRAASPRLINGLWVRVVDTGRALAARTYATELDVVLEIADVSCPENAGRWRLSGGPGGAVYERTTDGADLALDVRVLGSAYLGGETLAALGAAGLVAEVTPGTLARSSRAFTHDVAPFSGWVF